MQFQKDTNRNQIRQRRIYYQENTPESETGEMIYTDPNGNQVFSPFQDSPEEIQDFNDAEPNNDSNDNQNNQSLGQIEISFWKKSIAQLEEQYDSLKSFELFIASISWFIIIVQVQFILN